MRKTTNRYSPALHQPGYTHYTLATVHMRSPHSYEISDRQTQSFKHKKKSTA